LIPDWEEERADILRRSARLNDFDMLEQDGHNGRYRSKLAR